jgi:hypothetical protein
MTTSRTFTIKEKIECKPSIRETESFDYTDGFPIQIVSTILDNLKHSGICGSVTQLHEVALYAIGDSLLDYLKDNMSLCISLIDTDELANEADDAILDIEKFLSVFSKNKTLVPVRTLPKLVEYINCTEEYLAKNV